MNSSLEALQSKLQHGFKSIESFPEAPKRASVAIIIREHHKKLEIFYIRRTHQDHDNWSSHMAFPGGKRELNESDEEAAVREVREEVGFDLNSSELLLINQFCQIRSPR